jgi:hypothetical protein
MINQRSVVTTDTPSSIAVNRVSTEKAELILYQSGLE